MTKNIAHRGFCNIYPENTMLAFQKAVEAGCDGIEMDVHLTRDGEIVIIHDETLERTTNGTGMVKDYTLEQLCRFDAHGKFPGQHGFNPIPTLREYFDYIQDKDVFTNIELKNGIYVYPGLEEKCIAMIQEYGLTEKVMFSSFNHFSMIKCKQICPDIKTAFLISCWMVGAGAYAKANGADFINPRFQFLTDENLQELNDHGIGAQVWTVNEEQDIRDLVRRNVYAIITNQPDVMKRILAEEKAR